MHTRMLGAWLAAGLLVGLALAVPVSSAEGLRATLDGKAISLKAAGSLSCHDLDYPVLTCFRTAVELEAALKAPARGSGITALTLDAGYVVVYEHGQFGGAAQALSQDYSYLGTIGWNDRVSSLKSFGASGHFTENSPTGGFTYYFGTSTQVAYVGDTYNDKFSALFVD
jgi:hypothetical protein